MGKKNVADFYPLSPMQQGMLFHSLYAPDSGVYVEQLSCTLRGDLDVGAFERAWGRVVERHTILRTGFVGGGLKEPVQVVHRRVELPLAQQDWRGLSSKERGARLEAFLQQEQRRGFELSEPPLMRLALIRTAEDAYTFVWVHHHILLDGWSLPALLQEVFAFYGAFCRVQDLVLDPPKPYRDYIVWLRQQDMDRAEAFWRETLQGFTAPTPLVVGRSLESVADQDAAYGDIEIWLSQETTSALNALARRGHLTMNTLVQGAWALLLSRYSGEDDVLFGATVSGRPPDLPGAEFMIGLFINTLPVRVRVRSEALVVKWLQGLQAQVADMRQYEYSPLIQIQGWSDVPRGQPLFESIFVFENYPITTTLESQEAGSLAITDVRSVEQTNYPLTVVAGVGEEMMLRIVYDARLFDDETIRRMLGHLQTLLQGMAAAPEGPVSALPLLSAAERAQLLVDWNGTEVPFDRETTAHQLFEAQAARHPNGVAVKFEGQQLTYRELNHRANQLARYLQKLSVGPETLVGLCVEPSLDMIVGVLGVLKAGGAYLPLDPAYPSERLAFMVTDAQVPVLLTQTRLVDKLPTHQTNQPTNKPAIEPTIICLDADWDDVALKSGENVTSGVTAQNLAYAIYTSGSTGRPKGTLLQHEGLCNLIHYLISKCELGLDDGVLQFAAFSFDASVSEIFPTLAAGATLYLARRETLLSAPDLHRLLREEAITMVTLPPTLLAMLPEDELPALETVISAGEACPPEVAARWASRRRFLNGYGPTETTVAASYYRVEALAQDATVVPIGRPVSNTQVYLLDRELRPVPVGVPGELYVGGVGVARGYLNRPGLTAERFVPIPPSVPLNEGEVEGGRLYRTGDLARYRPDGNLEFLGRIDHQVKLRGFRIELGEIEAALGGYPAVRQAVALVREAASDDKVDERLVAYVVPEGKAEPGPAELREHLKARLPDYMLPSAYVMLETLPLLPNGKVDRRALPAPEGARPELERALVPPRDALESQLTRMWEEILDVRPIGVKDNFFELGGHSLLAVRLIGQIQKRFGKELSMVALFQEPTVEQLASILRGHQDGAATSLVPLQPDGSKRPLYFVHPSGGSVHWYADMARHLAPDQPLYGLQAQGLNGDRPIHTRIEEMAAHYVKAIRAFQPQGPYLLGSWSMGVSVVFELAQQLYAEGQEVALLIILDQGPVLPADQPEDDADYLMGAFGRHLPLSLEHLRQLGPDDQIAYVWEEARKAEWIYPEVTLPQFRHFVRMLRTHTEAWRQYVPQAYPGRITLFRALEQPEDAPEASDMGWGALATGGVEIYEVPGNHLSMIHEPHIRVLTEQLKACIAQVSEQLV